MGRILGKGAARVAESVRRPSRKHILGMKKPWNQIANTTFVSFTAQRCVHNWS